MSFLKNLLAIVGVATILLVAAASPRIYEVKSRLAEFDPKAMGVYLEMFGKILETGNAAEATVWKAPVKEGLSFEEVDETVLFVANEYNIKNVGELPLGKQVEAMRGKPYRIVKIYMFCNPLTAALMLDYNDAYGAYLPCRVTLVEDKKGRMALYTLNMDAMIYGGLPLPPELKAEALQVKTIMQDILRRGSTGEF